MAEEKDYGASEEAVARATGKSWQQWFTILDKAGARELDHTQTAKWLRETYAKQVTPWWAQALTVGYEYHIGRRVTGQTAGAGWELGVQKTVMIGLPALWELLISPQGLGLWLGKTKLHLKKGSPFLTADGGVGQIRSVTEHEKIRLTYQPKGRKAPYTMQVTLTCPRNNPHKTSLQFHFEKLANATERKQMKQRYQTVLATIAEAES